MTFPVRRLAGATALVAVCALALASCADDDPTPTSGSGATEPPAETPSRTTSEEPTEQPTSEAPTVETTGTAVGVYFVGDGPGGKPRLFREFHRVTGDPLTDAANLLASGEADDPDYRSLFPGGAFASVQASDGLLVVELQDDGWTAPAEGMSAREARLAIQQLVYTLQGVQQERVPVQVLLGGEPTQLFGIDTASPFSAASALKTLNLVSITSPTEGEAVSGDTLTVTGVANSFEASGPCRLIAGDREVALEPYQTDGWMEDRLFPFEVEIPLADAGTGDVVVQCETDDPSGGAEGDGPSIDTKLITVQ